MLPAFFIMEDHTTITVDISSLSDEVKLARYGTVEDSVELLQAERAPTSTGEAFDGWFECPVDGTTHRVSTGIRIDGRLLSPKAAQDAIEEKRRRRL